MVWTHSPTAILGHCTGLCLLSTSGNVTSCRAIHGQDRIDDTEHLCLLEDDAKWKPFGTAQPETNF